MTQYYFIQNGSKQGPFTKEELSNAHISPNTLVWFYPLKDWVKASDAPGLESLLFDHINPSKKQYYEIFFVFVGLVLLFVAVLFGHSSTNEKPEAKPSANTDIGKTNIYREISSQAFDADVDFDMYVEKFYRDARFWGISPTRPKETIIKFAPLDEISGLTHIHGISFGRNDDEKIEIYINPSTWKVFNKPMRYVLMYHELAHDVLNLKDLDQTESSEGKLLMYPALADLRSFTMDEFIVSSQIVFMEYKLENP